MLDDIRLTLYQFAVKFTYKVFVLTHTSKLKLEKSIVLFPSQSIMVALLLCDR